LDSGPVKAEVSFHQFLVSSELGGAGLTALHQALFFHEMGRMSRVWIPGDGPAAREAKRLGLEVTEYHAEWALSSWKIKALIGNWRLSRLLQRYPGGIVHVHSPGYYGGLRWGLMRSRVKRIAHVQIEESPALLRWAFRHPPNLIITCARFLVDHVRRTLPREYQERQAIVAVPNAVDTVRFHPGDNQEAKQKLGAPVGSPLAVMLANLAPHKGQETAIRAVALLKERGLHVTCWLAGTERGGAGTFTGHLNSLIQQLGVGDRIRLLGFRSDGPELLRAADFFLLPSTHEGLPLSILEAQATRVPVLAAPTAGIPEAVTDGQHGFLIPGHDAASYADRMQLLLEHPELKHRICADAYAKVRQEYTWSVYCKRISELYEELASDSER
jgi:glycosyltransferase involved in cell wall biosynthesis